MQLAPAWRLQTLSRLAVRAAVGLDSALVGTLEQVPCRRPDALKEENSYQGPR